MAGTVRILRVKRTDKQSEHLLLHVRQTSPARPLDLKLVATEHEHLYHTTVKASGVLSLKHDGFTGSENDFRDILCFLLLQIRPEGSAPETLQGLETVAAVHDHVVFVTIRKNIAGITQRVGTIKLAQDDEREEISAFDWVDTAVARSDDLRTELDILQTSLSSQQDQVAKLTAQLYELVKAKTEHEAELLRKFAQLLNAKKLKIRDQQRLLDGAGINPKTAAASTGAHHSASSRTVAPSGRGKRKADLPADEEEAVDADSNDDLPTHEETPPQTDEEPTADEDDAVSATVGRRGSGERRGIDVDDELPPLRELPFLRKGRPEAPEQDEAPGSIPKPVEDDDETDDEL